MDQAALLLKPGGTLSIVGIPAIERVALDIHEVRRKEITIRNVRRQLDCIPYAIDLVENGPVSASGFVTHEFDFADVPKAFKLVSGYGENVIKAIVRF